MKRNEHPLHQRQMEIGTGSIVNSNMPNKQENRGISAPLSKSHRRYLSRGDHSCSELLRNATTTPANPASATAICAVLDRASPGCIGCRLNRTWLTRTNTKSVRRLKEKPARQFRVDHKRLTMHEPCTL